MPRSAPLPINTIGSPAPGTMDFNQLRNNRILAAMQEAGATTRQTGSNLNQQLITAMQEEGATKRAGMQEAGATQRAGMARETELAGQRGQQQIARESIASSDRQNAAQIRANAEARQFQAAQQESMIRLNDQLETTRELHREAIATDDREAEMKYRQEVLDLEKETSLMNFAANAMNMQAIMRMTQKMYGSEEAAARMEDGISRMADDRNAAVMASEGAKKAVQNKVDTVLAQPGSTFESAFAEAMNHQQQPVSASILFDKDKLAEYLSDGDLNKYLAVHHSLDAIEAHETGRQAQIEKGEVEETVPGTPIVGFGASIQTTRKAKATMGGKEGTRVTGDLKRIQQARDNLSDLFRSKRPLADGKSTLGKQLLAFEQYRTGKGSSGIAMEAKARGLDPEQLRLDLTDFTMNSMPDTSWLWEMWPDVPPEMKDRVRSRMVGLTNILNPQAGTEPNAFVQRFTK